MLEDGDLFKSIKQFITDAQIIRCIDMINSNYVYSIDRNVGKAAANLYELGYKEKIIEALDRHLVKTRSPESLKTFDSNVSNFNRSKFLYHLPLMNCVKSRNVLVAILAKDPNCQRIVNFI